MPSHAAHIPVMQEPVPQRSGSWQHFVAVLHQTGFAVDPNLPRKKRKAYEYSTIKSELPSYAKLIKTFSQDDTYQDPEIEGFYADGVVSEEEKLFIPMLQSAVNGTLDPYSSDMPDTFATFIVHYSKKNVFLVADIISELSSEAFSLLSLLSDEDVYRISDEIWSVRHNIIDDVSLWSAKNPSHVIPNLFANIAIWIVSTIDLILNFKGESESRLFVYLLIKNILTSFSSSGVPQYLKDLMLYVCKRGHLLGLRDSKVDEHNLKRSLTESFEFEIIRDNNGTFVLADNGLAWVGVDGHTVFRHCLGAGSIESIAYVLVPLSSSTMLVGRNKTFTGRLPSNDNLNKLVVSAASYSYLSDTTDKARLLEFVKSAKANPVPLVTASELAEYITTEIKKGLKFSEGLSAEINGSLSVSDEKAFIDSVDGMFANGVISAIPSSFTSYASHAICGTSFNSTVFKLKIKGKTGSRRPVPPDATEVLVNRLEDLWLSVNFKAISDHCVNSVTSLVFNTSRRAVQLDPASIQHVNAVPLISPPISAYSKNSHISYLIPCSIEGVHLLVLIAKNIEGVIVASRSIRVRVVR